MINFINFRCVKIPGTNGTASMPNTPVRVRQPPGTSPGIIQITITQH